MGDWSPARTAHPARHARLARGGALLPGLGWLALFFFLPLGLILTTSLLSRSELGEITRPFTFENYRRLAGFGAFGFDSLYPQVILRSLGLGLATAAGCVVAALPLAFFIAGLPRHWKPLGLTLIIIPFWTNLLVRTYAWQILLAADGWISRGLAAVGVVPAGTALHPGTAAVFVVMVCDYLPFLVLPLYASVEKTDWSLAEAAADLGANPWQVFWHALLPQIRPGLVTGFVLVFLPASGQFVIPDLLGGARTFLLGNAVQQQFGSSLDWPFGSAIAALGLATMLLGLWLQARFGPHKDGEGLR